MNGERIENPYLSYTFKLWLVGLLFFLIVFRVFTALYFPEGANIIPVELLLGMSPLLLAYIWIQELRDKARLLQINEGLILARERLETAEINTIASLILTEEAKDTYVRGHSKRVMQGAVAIADKMGLSAGEKRTLRRAGILHDIGKLGISDAILQKPGKLDDNEWRIIRKHPQMAIDILGPLEFLEKEKIIIYHHHERYDGGGYPDGLRGEDIPLGSRILAVADTFDAMNSIRSYRNSLPKQDILAEMKRVAGTQLDPKIVDIFMEVLEESPELWARD